MEYKRTFFKCYVKSRCDGNFGGPLFGSKVNGIYFFKDWPEESERFFNNLEQAIEDSWRCDRTCPYKGGVGKICKYEFKIEEGKW